MNSLVLGLTPLRTTPRARPSRRRLAFATPSSQVNSASQDSPTFTTEQTPVGTLVKHATGDSSGQIGVVVSRKMSDQTKLDIIWTSDGATEIGLFTKLDHFMQILIILE